MRRGESTLLNHDVTERSRTLVSSCITLRCAQCWRRSQALLIIALVLVSTCAARRSLQHVHLQSSANRAVGIGCCTASGPQGLELVVRGFARALLAMRLQLRVRRSRLGKSGACASVLQAASCSSQSRRFLSPFPSRAPNFDKAKRRNAVHAPLANHCRSCCSASAVFT